MNAVDQVANRRSANIRSLAHCARSASDSARNPKSAAAPRPSTASSAVQTNRRRVVSFTVATLALMTRLGHAGFVAALMDVGALFISMLTAFLGLAVGTRLRHRLQPRVFQHTVFGVLLLLGLGMIVRSVELRRSCCRLTRRWKAPIALPSALQCLASNKVSVTNDPEATDLSIWVMAKELLCVLDEARAMRMRREVRGEALHLTPD